MIQGFTGQVQMWWNRSAFRTPYPEAVDELFASGGAPPCVVVFVDARYRTLPDAAHRGIQGKSSGGFGAMITPMLRPDRFGALATHAGDSLYEACYLPDHPRAVRLLRAWDGSIERWWDDFRRRAAFSDPADATLLGLYGVAACFSPDETGRPVLPFDTRTGRLADEVWQRWLAWDPVRMVADHVDALRGLRGLRGIWVDAGRADEYFLDLGATAFVEQLAGVGVSDVAFELFDAGHGGIDHRYPRSLGFLAERLSP